MLTMAAALLNPLPHRWSAPHTCPCTSAATTRIGSIVFILTLVLTSLYAHTGSPDCRINTHAMPCPLQALIDLLAAATKASPNTTTALVNTLAPDKPRNIRCAKIPDHAGEAGTSK